MPDEKRILSQHDTNDTSRALWIRRSEKPFVVRGKELLIIRGFPPNDEQRAKEDVNNPAVIAKETKRCLQDLIT
jgi:hypothetical protein